jgi:hypothetical protein
MKILRPEVEACLVAERGLHDLFDNLVKQLFNITDEEYDFIAATSTDDELENFVAALGTDDKPATFRERRLALELRNRKLKKLHNGNA